VQSGALGAARGTRASRGGDARKELGLLRGTVRAGRLGIARARRSARQGVAAAGAGSRPGQRLAARAVSRGGLAR
jgi:hypothetical protein